MTTKEQKRLSEIIKAELGHNETHINAVKREVNSIKRERKYNLIMV